MDKHEVVERLFKLAHLDIDAVGVYDEALVHVEDDDVRRNFEMFKADHSRHVDELSGRIADLGGVPPERKPDLAGRMAEWTTSVRSMRGTHGAVKAIHTAERYHVNRYGEAMEWDLPQDLAMLVEQFHGDELRHLAYVEEKAKAPTT